MEIAGDVEIGTLVEIHGTKGTVKFVGSTEFATGRWVGIELVEAAGKNDGSVQGTRYFSCPENHGVFVRASQIKSLISISPSNAVSSLASTPAHAQIRSPQLQRSTSPTVSIPATPTTAPVPSTPSSNTAANVNAARKEDWIGGKTVPLKEFEELRLRLKLLEGKRAEDKEKLKDLERLKSEAEQSEISKSKQSSRVSDLQAEVIALKKSVKDILAAKEDLEMKYHETLENLELITLDKEVAEEKAESIELEMEILKERVEELSLTLDIVKSQNQVQPTGSPSLPPASSDISSTSEVGQLEKHNERLKEALIKLRDVSAARETELEKKNRDLERENNHLRDVQKKYEEVKIKFSTAQDQIENLKMQLDDALENTEMIEILTVKNLKLSETTEQQKEAILDLEALKELNEELEENHVETEREMLVEIDRKDARIRELGAEIDSLVENNADYENTILQFRDLVETLQTDLDDLRQKSKDENDEGMFGSQTQEMLKLNLQLQNAFIKNTGKSIELELRRMDGIQAKEHVEILHAYLPPQFYKQDESSIYSILLSKRLFFKSDLIFRFLDEYLRSQHSSSLSTFELFTVRQIQQRATYLCYLGKKFTGFVYTAGIKTFLDISSLRSDLELAEKKLDDLVEALKNEQLHDVSSLVAIDRICAQMEAICDSLIRRKLSTYSISAFAGQAAALSALSMLDTIEVSLENLTQMKFTKSLGTQQEFQSVYTRAKPEIYDLVMKLKMTIKNTEKRYLELGDSCLKAEEFKRYEDYINGVAKILKFYAGLQSQFLSLQQDESITISTVESIVSSMSKNLFDQPGQPLIGDVKTQLLKYHELFDQMYESMLLPANISAYDPKFKMPWIARASEILQEVKNNPELDRELAASKEKINSLSLDVKTREENYNQAFLKVQILEKRIEGLREKSSVVDTYEIELKKMKEQEKNYMDAIVTLQNELENLEEKLQEELKREKKTLFDSSNMGNVGNISNKRISSLFAALLYLKDENLHLKEERMKAQFKFLSEPLKIHRPATCVDRNMQQACQELKQLKKDVLMTAANTTLIDLSRGKANEWAPMISRPKYQFEMQQAAMASLQQRSLILEGNLRTIFNSNKTVSAGAEKELKMFGKIKLYNGTNEASDGTNRKLILDHSEFKSLHEIFCR